jgi:hypothetical protein
VDWGEVHHDGCLLDRDGSVLATRRIVDGLAGVGELDTLMAAHAEDPAQVAVGIETDRGLLVGALAARFAIHPDGIIVRSLPGLGVVLGARGSGRVRRRP